MHLRKASSSSRLALVATLLLGMCVSGCGDAGVGKTYPVRGTITLDGQPFGARTTIVLFKPDASRGNTSSFDPVGTVDAAGNYTLITRGANGAPPGWYNVTVTARAEASVEHPTTPGHQRPVAGSLLPARYGQAHTSGMSIEVVQKPAPGTYDLKLTN